MYRAKKDLEGKKRGSSSSSSSSYEGKEKPSLLDKGKAAVHLHLAKKNLEGKEKKVSTPTYTDRDVVHT